MMGEIRPLCGTTQQRFPENQHVATINTGRGTFMEGHSAERVFIKICRLDAILFSARVTRVQFDL